MGAGREVYAWGWWGKRSVGMSMIECSKGDARRGDEMKRLNLVSDLVQRINQPKTQRNTTKKKMERKGTQ